MRFIILSFIIYIDLFNFILNLDYFKINLNFYYIDILKLSQVIDLF